MLTAPSPAVPAPGASLGSRFARRAGFLVAVCVTAGCLAVAAGTVVHRIRLWPIRTAAPDVGIGHDSLLVLVPVPSAKVREGDLVVIDRKDTHTTALYRVDSVLSPVDPAIEIRDAHDHAAALNLPATTTWRVSREVPVAGFVLRVLPGSIIAWMLIALGVALVGWSRWLRRRRERSVTPAPTV